MLNCFIEVKMADEASAPTTNGEGGVEIEKTQQEIDSNALHDELVMKQQEAIDKEVSEDENWRFTML